MPFSSSLRRAVDRNGLAARAALASLAGASLLLALAGSPAQAQPQRPGQPPQMFTAGSGPDELWDVTMSMQMAGMSMPARTTQICKKKDAGKEALMSRDAQNCKTTNLKTAGNTTTFDFVCTGDSPMTGHAEMTATAEKYDGKMQMKGTRKGEEFDMSQTMSGRRVGACTDNSKETVAAIQKQGEDARAQTCAGLAKGFDPSPFFGAGASCASSQKEFCSNISATATRGRTAAGYQDALGRNPPEYVQRGFAACGQDVAATRAAACTDGVATRNWAFVGSGNCDNEVRTAGDANCKGRAYTGMDRALLPLCNRYASLMRGTATADAQGQAAAARAAAAQPQPAQPNPIDAGVDAVRKLLPF